MSQVAFEIAVIIVLLLGNGVLAMAEMSLVSARKPRLAALATGGSKAAARALELKETPNSFLSTVQIGITMVGILAGAFGGATVAKWLGGVFAAWGIPALYADPAGLVLVVLVITYLSLIIGELVPKRLALSAPERYACVLAGPMRLLAKVATPAVKVLGWSTDAVLKLLGAHRETREHVTEEEIRAMMQEGTAAGVFHHTEPKMVQRVLELDEVSVKEIMTPRPRVVFLDQEETHDVLWPRIAGAHYSYFPVYHRNRDNVVGVVSVKALYANLAAGAPVVLRDLMVPPFFVPSTQTAVQLLDSFRKAGRHFAIVADEFGSVVGVVSLVDVLESIVGDVPLRENRERIQIRPREDGSYIVDGAAGIGDLEERLPGLRFSPDDDGSFQTLAGFVLHRLGHIPAEGETFTASGYRFEVIDMDRQRVDKVMLRPVPASEGTEAPVK